MSEVFFDELAIPRPKWQLYVGSGQHGKQTAEMLHRIEEILISQKPNGVLVYGDTNSTLAGALAASKLSIPIVHVEAGLRSYDRKMPEEINRVITDAVSQLLLCPTTTAVENLRREGVEQGVHCVGDVMYDAVQDFGDIAVRHANVLKKLPIDGPFAIMTCHRASNTDDDKRLQAILLAANIIAERIPIIFAIHPRTKKGLKKLPEFMPHKNLYIIEPISYLEMLALLKNKNSRLVLTDSGGLQKEAFFNGVQCVTFRDTTEWIETVESNANILTDAKTDRIVAAAESKLDSKKSVIECSHFYGNGDAAQKIIDVMMQTLG